MVGDRVVGGELAPVQRRVELLAAAVSRPGSANRSVTPLADRPGDGVGRVLDAALR
ncbi:hypothetical protein [Streptomyces sp. NPDC052701]|uniref:hypothetical protein n=1 Tax=Streptomyces sp. NPDC052701 TaxID=3155533 RepID=UPI0034419968